MPREPDTRFGSGWSPHGHRVARSGFRRPAPCRGNAPVAGPMPRGEPGGAVLRPTSQLSSGASTRLTMAITLIRMFIEGPDVSLNGSPTVSPTTVA